MTTTTDSNTDTDLNSDRETVENYMKNCTVLVSAKFRLIPALAEPWHAVEVAWLPTHVTRVSLLALISSKNLIVTMNQ